MNIVLMYLYIVYISFTNCFTLRFRRSLIISLLVKVDLISVWKKVHAMKWLFIYRRDLVGCYVFGLSPHFFISLNMWYLIISIPDLCRLSYFHVDDERMIVKTREM